MSRPARAESAFRQADITKAVKAVTQAVRATFQLYKHGDENANFSGPRQ